MRGLQNRESSELVFGLPNWNTNYETDAKWSVRFRSNFFQAIDAPRWSNH